MKTTKKTIKDNLVTTITAGFGTQNSYYVAVGDETFESSYMTPGVMAERKNCPAEAWLSNDPCMSQREFIDVVYAHVNDI